MTAERLDAARDAAALLRARHDGDHEGREAILGNCDALAVAEALAEAMHRTITATYGGCRGCTAEFITSWQQELRSGMPEPVKGTPPMTPAEQGREQEAIEHARRPRGCGSCGATFIGDAAFTIHRDPGWPGGCLPPGALGQLEQIDGAWCRRGSGAAS